MRVTRKEIHDAGGLPTFQELAAKMGLDVSPRAVKARIRRSALTRASCHRKFPTPGDVCIQLRLQEETHPHSVTRNTPTEPGDTAGFSSPALTAWYVQQFLYLNFLKGDAPCK